MTRRKNLPTKLPEKLGPIHFVGIGGIGMSGIAELLLNYGYSVQGSDTSATRITAKLATLGAKVFDGHHRDNVSGCGVVVVSSAIKDGNPEVAAAIKEGIPVIRRAEMLAELMRLKSNVAVAGTHGKTTTTTLVSALLEHGGFDPTVINGGIIRSLGSNARKGQGEWMVVEADESDGTFIKLPATVAVVTNIDPEHLDHYGGFDDLKAAFDAFLQNIPFYGFAVCCVDNEEVRAMVARSTNRRIVTYGMNPDADIRIENLEYRGGFPIYDILLNGGETRIDKCSLPMPGDHNVVNSLAAVAVADQLGMSGRDIKKALMAFGGVNRRFTHVGIVNGVEIIDDYAHHPVEISAVLKAARQVAKGRVLAIHQPHRFSRLSSLFDEFSKCFGEADAVAIADVYSGGESPIPGINRDALIAAIAARGIKGIVPLSGEDCLVSFVKANAFPGDLVVCMGAGSISTWANSLPRRLAVQYGNS